MKFCKPLTVLGLLFFTGVSISVCAQQSVVQIFKSDRTLADELFEKGEIVPAMKLYERSKRTGNTYLMLGRGYFLLKEYRRCAEAYDRAFKRGDKFDRVDYLNYAEVNLSLKNYEQAELNYQRILDAEPDNEWIQKKLWRISNMHYLYEDSIHFATRFLSINTPASEWGATPYDGGILFLSNRPSNKPVKRLDAATQLNFYEFYQAIEKPDSLQEGWGRLYATPGHYTKAISTSGNTGSFALYDNRSKMVYTTSSKEKNKQGIKTLGLYFAELRDGKWQPTGEFPHNEAAWSLADPFLDEQHNTLFFSSDKSGGYGGKDLYRSEWVNGSWSEPVNLGEVVNTPMDEVSPYVYNNMFYFSSNGHPGFGGLDIFKTELADSITIEPVNLGHPLNSPTDDFSFHFVDATGSRGFLSSNRKAGGLDDDIYEFDMDMQTYPLNVAGIMKQMDHALSDSSNVRVLRNARIRLVDTVRKAIVDETTSDGEGNFSLSIPYFSKYGIYVIDADGVENMAVFEVPRQRKESTKLEIVVIKDIFQTLKN